MNADTETGPYPYEGLLGFSTGLLLRGGLEQGRARIVAEILLEGDLMGHTTHGMQLLGSYLAELAEGRMRKHGDPKPVSDTGSTMCWDGNYLPGPWLVVRALEAAMDRIRTHSVVTVVIRRSHHIASLASYPKRATDTGMMMILASSDPSVRSVAPFGGITPQYTPDPIAAGIPTAGDPIIIDTSMSCTAMGTAARLARQGKQAPEAWFLDGTGRPSADAAVLDEEPPGSILPLGGVDLGYKGFALGLLIEALTSALGGSGRADGIGQMGASVFLQLIDPEAFGGRAQFVAETAWLAQACRTTPPRPGSPAVRLPGERALSLRETQLASGVELHLGSYPV